MFLTFFVLFSIFTEKQEENDIQENNSDNKTTIPQIHENVDGRGNGDKEDRDRGEGKTPETESSSPWEYLDKLFCTDDFLRNLELKQITETQLDSPDCSEPETSELLPQTEPEEQLELIQTTETPLDDANGSDPEPYEFLPLTDPDEQLFDEMWRELSLEKEDNIQPARATCQQLSDGTEEETAAGLRNDSALEKEAGEQCITIDFNFFTKLETALAALTETPPEISESNKCKVKRQEVGAAQTKIQQLEEEKSQIKAKRSLRDDEESKDLTECPANIGMVSENWSPISLLMSQRSLEFKTSTKDNIKVDRSGKKASAEAMLGDSAEQNHPVMSPEKNCEKNPKSSLILHPELTREDQRQSQTAAPKEDKAERKGEITEMKTYNFSQKDLQDNHPLLKPKLLSEKSPKLSSIPHQEFVLEDPRQSQTAAQRVDKVERRRNKSKDSKIKPYWQEPDGSRESSVSEVEKAETQSEILERPLKRKQTAEAEVDSKRAKELTPAQAEEDLEKCEDMDQTFEMDMPSHETGGKTKSHFASYSSGLTEQETFTGERSAEQKAADMEALAACRRSQRGKDPCENQPQLVKRLPTNTECKGEKTKGKTGKGTQRGRKKTEIQGKKDEN
ncbi:uncharacterized protein LOC131468553 isoform X1 [Solea solea]|uniref:uncharacterized protein LOC131468553 isoform X1 n=1 Tax=Solea solea TaxID=90069 RepID=UPI00272BE070|nr:uncharacterized protein LOC131468553 isoform X1 [Solea solea]